MLKGHSTDTILYLSIRRNQAIQTVVDKAGVKTLGYKIGGVLRQCRQKSCIGIRACHNTPLENISQRGKSVRAR